eukprot:TRINITY_DN4243_c0_g3_i11.p2 TRINITY_DN4243_c0_g3~~TRINITY_DN4243_c0_g3_i11.p2  ORF type:complete len:106 (+),score=20.86 TRINITY_DN4243_c0_g3_i11:94-411(+)
MVVFVLISSYLFLGIFVGSSITNFIVVVLLNCMDFWLVKNVTGRILVSLRWWNRINEKGENEWVYEGPPRSNSVRQRRNGAQCRLQDLLVFLVLDTGDLACLLVL